MTHQTMPPDWDRMLANIDSAVAEALAAHNRREQAWAGQAALVNWETWETAHARLAERLGQWPQPSDPLEEIDAALADSEKSLLGYVKEAEEMRRRVEAWIKAHV